MDEVEKLEHQIEKYIDRLDHDQKIKFSVSCIQRTIDLYKKVDELEDISLADSSLSKGKAFEALNNIYKKAKNNLDLEKQTLKELLKKCDPLMLDVEDIFENSTENEVCLLVAQGVDYFLNYLLTKENEYIKYISSNNIEIVNQIESDRYGRTVETHVGDKAQRNYLDAFYKKEYNIQLKILELIEGKDDKGLETIIEENKIEY